MEKINCKDCVYSEEEKSPLQVGTTSLKCHFNPPTMIVMTSNRGMQQMGMFPPVNKDYWCGKGKKKESVN